MVPAHITDVPALFLMGVWSTVWFSFIILGRHGKRRLPVHPALVRYSSAVFVSLSIFYWLAFSDIGASDTNVFNYFFSNGAVRSAGILLSILGATCMGLSRWYLRELTLAEVLFAKSESNVSIGLYRYFKHPMYLGLSLILVGSYVLYPNILTLPSVAIVLFSIEKKKQIEECNQ